MHRSGTITPHIGEVMGMSFRDSVQRSLCKWYRGQGTVSFQIAMLKSFIMKNVMFVFSSILLFTGEYHKEINNVNNFQPNIM